MSIYPEVFQQLEIACSRYRHRSIGVKVLQLAVRQAEETVTAYEERELRKFLHKVEGKLELIQFTTEECRVFEESLPVVLEIEEYIKR